MIKVIFILLYLLPTYLHANEVCDKILKSISREESSLKVLGAFNPEAAPSLDIPTIDVNLDLKDISISNQSSYTDLGIHMTTSWDRPIWMNNFITRVLLNEWFIQNPNPPEIIKNKYNPEYGNWINQKNKAMKKYDINCSFERNSEVEKLIDKIWSPEAYSDEIGSHLEIKNYKKLHITNDTNYDYNFALSSDVKFQVKNVVRFSDFPFDTISVIADLNFNKVNLKPDLYIQKKAIDKANNLLSHQWDVIWHNLSLDNTDNKNNKKLIYRFDLKRESFYYVGKIILPIILIICLSFANFFIKPKEIEAKLNLTVGSLLSLIAYNFVFGEDIPKLNYLTTLDLIILISYFFAFISTAFAITTSYLHARGNIIEGFHPWDKHLRYMLPMSYFLILLIILKWPMMSKIF